MEPNCPSPESTAPKSRTPWNTVSARVLSLVSRKGGVGKTTSAINLGAAYALSGHTVLVIGIDPQCGIAPSLGCRMEDLDTGLIDLYENDASLTDLARTSPLKDLFFISPRIRDLKEEDRFQRLLTENPDVFVQQIDRARNLYDTIIIDCPPHLGSTTRAALLASDGVLVPVQAEELCRDSLGTLLGALDTFNEARGSEILDGPELEGIFLTMLNERTRVGRHVAAKVSEEFGPVLMDNSVPRNTRLSEMALRGKPCVIYDRRSTGSRAYFNLADEILERYRLRSGMLNAMDDTDLPDGLMDTVELLGDTEVNAPLRAHQISVESHGQDHRGGLEGLLGDLRAQGSPEASNSSQPAMENNSPEMVSLDDLLAEEESESRDSWDGYGERLN